MAKVWIVHVNDNILRVLKTKKAAEALADEYRESLSDWSNGAIRVWVIEAKVCDE